MSSDILDALMSIQHQRPTAPFRKVNFAPVEVDLTTQSDGSLRLDNRQPLSPLPVRQIGEYLRIHARNQPNRAFLAEPNASSEWNTLSYAQALERVNALSQWLLNQSSPAGRPILILSENSINQALLQFAAMQVGIPVMPVSAAYSLMSKTCGKIADLAQRFAPSLIYAEDGERFQTAIEVAKKQTPDAQILCHQPGPLSDAIMLGQAQKTEPTKALEAAFNKVNHDTIARLLLTSGSTGSPKAVIMTQRNIIASGVLWDQVWPFLKEQPPIMLDWLPWNHTAGAHGALSMVLRHGGTLYLDDGKPVPKLIDRTIAHLRAIKPNVMVNVPRGLDMLVAAMEENPDAAKDIFTNLQVIVYGGAALTTNTLLRLEQLSVQATGNRIPLLSSLGSTETTMPATLIWWPPKLLGTLGLPAPGVEAKLILNEDRYEIRFRGPSITPGYLHDEQANTKSFDKEGFLKTGDAVQFVDYNDPAQGLVYAGRMSENFKLSSGTWVSVATVRGHLLAQLHPFVSDAVLTGHNCEQMGALFFLNTHQIRKHFPELSSTNDNALTTFLPLQKLLVEGVQRHNQNYPGSSTRICRALLLDTPPSIDDNEITDKGYINQSGVLKHRSDAVKRLHACTASTSACLFFPG